MENFSIQTPVVICAAVLVLNIVFAISMSIVEAVKKRKLPVWRPVFNTALVIVVVGIVVFLFTSNEMKTSNIDTQAVSRRAKLDAKVQVYNGILFIKNLNKYNWHEYEAMDGRGIKISINNDFAYLYRETIRPGQTVRIPLTEFADGGGRRFNLLLFKIKTVTVSCNEGEEVYGL